MAPSDAGTLKVAHTVPSSVHLPSSGGVGPASAGVTLASPTGATGPASCPASVVTGVVPPASAVVVGVVSDDEQPAPRSASEAARG